MQNAAAICVTARAASRPHSGGGGRNLGRAGAEIACDRTKRVRGFLAWGQSGGVVRCPNAVLLAVFRE